MNLVLIILNNLLPLPNCSSPIQRKNELNNANGKIKNSNLGNCNLSKISEIKTYFVQFQKEKEKSDKK